MWGLSSRFPSRLVTQYVVYREAILDRAASVLLNKHPSGNREPSPEYVALTKALVEAVRELQLPVTDQVTRRGVSSRVLRNDGLRRAKRASQPDT